MISYRLFSNLQKNVAFPSPVWDDNKFQMICENLDSLKICYLIHKHNKIHIIPGC